MNRTALLLVVAGALTASSRVYVQTPADTIRQAGADALGTSEATAVQAELGPNPWGLPDDPLLGFIEIPAGDFTMGTESEQSEENERPLHTVTLEEYFIGKYEVTVAQFAAFVQDLGYPADSRSLEGPTDRPVRHVTWHDAIAYCAWLTGKLRAWPGTPSVLADHLRGDDGVPPWLVTLPSEAEWEKAARGTDGRVYPWGNTRPDSTRGNYAGAGPSAVGSYPNGGSSYDVQDMAGNVFEWTRSLWGPDVSSPRYRYPYLSDDGREDLDAPANIRRVMRGGSFFLGEDGLRTTRRFRYDPDNRFGTRGFRVVVSTGPPLSLDAPTDPERPIPPVTPDVPQ
jgi:formylglycine-generating enzyme required for sulfatase activity